MSRQRGLSESGFIGILLLLVALGVVMYWATWRYWQPAEVPEQPAAAIRQADGSLVLEKRQEATAKPAQKVPRGTIPVRVVQVKVAPKRPSVTPAQEATAEATADCPPVTVDLTLVRAQDGAQRVLASSPDGEVIGGLDVPLVALQLPSARPWAAGVSYDLNDRRVGGWVDHDIGPFRVGLELQDESEGVSGRIRAGVRF